MMTCRDCAMPMPGETARRRFCDACRTRKATEAQRRSRAGVTLITVPCAACRVGSARCQPEHASAALCQSCRNRGDAPAPVIEATIAAWEAWQRWQRRSAVQV